MPKTILVVDDDPSVHDILRQVLTKEGYRVLSSANGPAAIEWMKKELPALIVLDFEMPGWGGEQVFERLREVGLTADIPVIFLSSLPLMAQVTRVPVARNVRFHNKPIDFPGFLKSVRELGGQPA